MRRKLAITAAMIAGVTTVALVATYDNDEIVEGNSYLVSQSPSGLDESYPAGKEGKEKFLHIKYKKKCNGWATVDDGSCVVIETEGIASGRGGVRPTKTPSPTPSSTVTTATATSTPSPTLTTPCTGDGTTGNRVQAVYAVPSDQVNRASTIVPLIQSTYAPRTNNVFFRSGQQNVRWVHDSSCKVNVIVAVLTPTGDDSFSNTKTELRALGLTRTDRKYLVWLDASVSGSCGIANVQGDSTPEQTNRNNTGPTFGRVSASCWGNVSSVEAHELAHTLGAVQMDAPHSNGGWHCFDERDRMCYYDGQGPAMQYICDSTWESLLDCNNNDYYAVLPEGTNYLTTHWNLYNSSFLQSGL